MKQILLVGASGGIGKITTETLLDLGYQVIGTFFQHPENVEKFKDKENFYAYKLDIRDPKSIEELASAIDGSIYAIVNCCGIVRYESGELNEDYKIWQDTLNTNASGNYYIAEIFHKRLEEKGRFVMVSSTDSYFGGTITAAYAASKAVVNSLTKSFSLMFQDKKILVNSIAPGWVLTPMIAANGDEFLRKVANINPQKRNALPRDVANLIKFLISEDNDYINGQIISLEGGYTNQDPTLLIEEEINS